MKEVRMMKKLNDIFELSYGNKLDLNKMKKLSNNDKDTVNFVGRTAENLGVTAIVKRIQGIEPYDKGLITVALGGSILSSFVQLKPFYTAQNIMVLTPIRSMTFQEKVFYCECIKQNKFRYSAFGREANKTLHLLKVPDNSPNWVTNINMSGHLQKRVQKESSRLLEESK